MRSPKAGSARNRSTRFSQACGDWSARKVVISSVVGGSPRRSSESRRMRVRGSASGEWVRSSFWSLLRMRASRGWWSPAGRGGFSTLVKVQCFSYFAPCWIQVWMSFFSESERERWESCGGMTSSGSLEMMRCQMREASGSPGTMAGPLSPFLKAPSGVSRRRSASRALASKPWQAKHRSERRGRISELKPSWGSSLVATEVRAKIAEMVRRRIVIMRRCDPSQSEAGYSRKKEDCECRSSCKPGGDK